MGLGAYPLISLAEARERRDHWRKVLLTGHNPIEARRALPGSMPTFGDCATRFIASMSSQWRSEKHKKEWQALDAHAKLLWPMPVNHIDMVAVLAVLKPIWETKRETASRLRGRIEAVLNYAKAHTFRTGENPAAWRGNLAHVLPARKNIERAHYAAVPYQDMPRFITQLHSLQDMREAASCLEFIILTAARTGEAREARWLEIDLDDKVWTIPADRMKSGREHRVPLSDRAIELLAGTDLIPGDGNDFLFPGQVRGKPFSRGACAAVLKSLRPEATIHGFRSSFRDWAAEVVTVQREVVEQCLAHSLGNMVELAYRRGDILDKRRKLMDQWAQYIEPRGTLGNVVNLIR
jgi:integrase